MEGDGVQPATKAEIDTTAPFRSVKEAVVLFGERVLGSEVYGSKVREMHDRTTIMEYGDETAVGNDELKETKQSLQRAREESMQMATSLLSLQQELEETKMELQQLKTRRSNRHRRAQIDLTEIEEIKFVEDSRQVTEQVVKTETTATQKVEFEKKKYVTFANPPCVAQVVFPNHAPTAAEAVLHRQSSLRKKKKMQLIPLIKGIFSKKRGSSQVAFA